MIFFNMGHLIMYTMLLQCPDPAGLKEGRAVLVVVRSVCGSIYMSKWQFPVEAVHISTNMSALTGNLERMKSIPGNGTS